MWEYKLHLPENMIFHPPTKLDDINLSLLGKVDDKIKGLVRALIALGIDTIGSCEGHLNDANKWPYPWVSAWALDRYKELSPILSEYNGVNEVNWVIDGITLEPNRENRNVTSMTELIRLQKSAQDLAKFLFNNRPYRERIVATQFRPVS